jgi:hypothetical protein
VVSTVWASGRSLQVDFFAQDPHRPHHSPTTYLNSSSNACQACRQFIEKPSPKRARMESGQHAYRGSASRHPPESEECRWPPTSPDSGGRAGTGWKEHPQQLWLLPPLPPLLPLPLLPSLAAFLPMIPCKQDIQMHPKEAVRCSPHDTPSVIGAPSLNHQEEMAVKVVSEQILPADSPNSGGQAATSGEEPLQKQLVRTSSARLVYICSQLQPNEATTVELALESVPPIWPSSWGPPQLRDENMMCQCSPEEDQAFSIV